jgi:hypothetical protein
MAPRPTTAISVYTAALTGSNQPRAPAGFAFALWRSGYRDDPGAQRLNVDD